ncbi:hypothetical protein D0C28_26865 [Rhizobium sp. AU243]|nr:hypothetical protein D0C28_26865 [Rhizobium sp. AU243]
MRFEVDIDTLNSSLYIARNTFQILKARFEPLSDDESRIEVSRDPENRYVTGGEISRILKKDIWVWQSTFESSNLVT